MNLALGIDTSNYTTSLALYDAQAHEICQVKRLLPVKEGEKGLRQSDAVFHHVQQLPELMDKLWKPGCGKALSAVGVSARPRDAEGSYMPVSYTHLDVYKRQPIARSRSTLGKKPTL